MPPDCQEIFLSQPDQVATLRVVADDDDFRRRLREAVESAPSRKHVYGEDVSEGGLSKIISGGVKNPRLFTVKSIANRLGTTVGALLGETGAVVTDADRAKLREFVVFLSSKFDRPGDVPHIGRRDASDQKEWNVVNIDPKEDDFVFSVPKEQFKQLEFDYPQRWHYWLKADQSLEQKVAAGLRGIPGGMGRVTDSRGGLLNPRDVKGVHEIFDRLHQIVRVEGSSMEPRYVHGDFLRIDTTIRDPQDGSVVAIYCDELGGGMVGLMKRQGDRVVLKKKNRSFPDVLLPSTGWVLIGKVVAVVDRNEDYIEEV